jgi:nuclear transport factor 2 (NTF2) superfamily protein
MQLATGKPTKFGAEAVRFAERYQPGGSLWYTRLAMERLIFDELERMADPDAAPRFRRIEQRARRETGQQFFWRPGRRGPERAPDLAAVFRR